MAPLLVYMHALFGGQLFGFALVAFFVGNYALMMGVLPASFLMFYNIFLHFQKEYENGKSTRIGRF